MRYKLIDRERGVILSRSPEFCEDKLFCEIEGAPDGATAIFEHREGRMKYFRELKSGACELPLGRFDSGTLTLTVAVLDGSADPKRWLCEELRLQRLGENTVLILPNDGDITAAITELRIENSELRRMFGDLCGKYAELSERLERIMEGYDLT